MGKKARRRGSNQAVPGDAVETARQRRGHERGDATAGSICEPFGELLARLGVSADADYVVFSDGSGTDFSMGCGYATAVIDVRTGERALLVGALSRGTVNIAEMLGVVQALDFLIHREESARQDQRGRKRTSTVHIVTDSQYCQTTGDRTSGRMARRNVGLWTLCESYARQGLVLHWHHINRATCGLNVLCDAAANLARVRLRDYDIGAELRDRDASLDLNLVNPD